jgi:hypothetical protein
MEYLRLIFIGQEVFTEWCNKPKKETCFDYNCSNPCKYKMRKDL